MRNGPHPRARRATILVAAAVAVLILAACGGGGTSTTVLEGDMRAQEAALDALRNRLTQLTNRVDGLALGDPDGAADLNRLLDDLDTRVRDIEDAVNAQATSGEDATASVAAQIGALREDLDEIVSGLRDLTTVVTQLGRNLDALEDRLDSHIEDDMAHGGGPGLPLDP